MEQFSVAHLCIKCPVYCSLELSVIRQKGESRNGCFKKTKHFKFSEKRTFLTPLIRTRTYVYQGVRNIFFRKIWRALFSWNTHFEIYPFALLPTNYAFLMILTNLTMLDFSQPWLTVCSFRHTKICYLQLFIPADFINSFHTTGLFLDPLKTENLRKKPVA